VLLLLLLVPAMGLWLERSLALPGSQAYAGLGSVPTSKATCSAYPPAPHTRLQINDGPAAVRCLPPG
jgi:hypothetical protein